jgi:pimeloyl-ACP methyl ester carboxylesterase
MDATLNDPQNAELPHLDPPSRLLLLLEGRALAEYAHMMLAWSRLARLPRGDGHPVLVLPGFLAGDASTRPMRKLLRELGYRAYGWKLGRNLGAPPEVRDAMRARLAELHRRSGRKVSVIGWSLGGIYAREMARQAPNMVRQVITLGSPFNGHPLANNADALFRRMNPGTPVDWEGFLRRRVPPGVPATAIYSKTDGIVAWQCSLEEAAPNTENIEVRGSHCGLGVNPQVLKIIARKLALPETG